MTFKDIIKDEIRGNIPTYKEYFLATAFSVLAVFMTLMVIFNPLLMLNSLAVNFVMATKAVLIIICIFLVMFIYYSQYTFLRHRSRDYAMFTILGMKRSRLTFLNFCESATVYFAGFMTGVLVSLLLEKLIFMGFAKILDIPEFGMYLPTKAIIVTFIIFAAIFAVMQIVSCIMLHRMDVKKYLLFGQKTQKMKKINVPVAIIGAILILGGYYLALTVTDNNLFQRIIPVVLMVVVGLYFFYSELCPWVFQLMEKHKACYFKGVNMLWISDMRYRIKDFTLILYLITVTMSVGLTGFTAVFNVATSELADALVPNESTLYPIAVLKVTPYCDTLCTVPKIEKLLSDEQISYTESTVNLYTILDKSKALIRNSDLKYLFDGVNMPVMGTADTMRLLDSEHKIAVHLPLRYVYAVKDDVINRYTEGYDECSLTLFEFKAPKNLGKQLIPINDSNDTQQTGEMLYSSGLFKYFYFIMRRTYLLLSFYFVIVFYVCAGCMLYFKFYNNATEEGAKYLSYLKMGLSPKEIRKSATIQIATLFLLPTLMSILNAAMAMSALLRDGAPATFMTNTLCIILFTLFIQVIYYFVIRSGYLRKILP